MMSSYTQILVLWGKLNVNSIYVYVLYLLDTDVKGLALALLNEMCFLINNF